jgi:hypothetical protein
VKWKEAKAALAKWAPVGRSKGGGSPRPPTAPKAQWAEPSALQESLGPGWNHNVSGGRVVKAATYPLSTPFPANH